MDFDSKINKIWDLVLEYSPKLVLALLVFIVGFWVANKLTNILKAMLKRANIDESVTPFIVSLANAALKVMLLFSIAEIVGIETASFIAVLAAAGFAIGLALQGSLSNFAAGVLVLIFKPYKVGDLVMIQERIGYVDEIQIINTILNNVDNERIIIPNSVAINDIVKNFSSDGTARLNLDIFISYNQPLEAVQRAILDELDSCDSLLKTPTPICEIKAFDTHNIQLVVKPYCLPENYEKAMYQANTAIKNAMIKGKIEIAYVEGVEMGTIEG